MTKKIFGFLFVLLLLTSFSTILAENKPADKKPTLSQKEKGEIEKLIKKYFGAKEEPEKQNILGELGKYDSLLSKNDVSDIAKIVFGCAKDGPKHNGKSPAKCTHPDYPGEYIINVPAGAKRGEKTGIFIGLHGGGEDVGDASQIQSLLGIPNPKLISVFPTVIEKVTGGWNTEGGERYVMEIIAELKRTYNIDTNQIFIAGHSMGGGGTWSIGTRYPDIFAALSSMAGGLFESRGIIPVINLKNTPIWFYHSTDDPRVPVEADRRAAEYLKGYKEKYGPYEYVYKEYTDIGHGLPKEGLAPIWKWMFAKKRSPYPKLVIWAPSRPYKKIFYWLKVDEPNYGQQIEAKIEGNKISITSTVPALTIFLNEKLVDLSKPVIVEAGGEEKFKGNVGYSLGALVETIADKNDPEMFFTSRIKIE